MDRVTAARAALGEIVRRVGGYLDRGPNTGLETFVVTDPEHDQYGLFRVGWRGGNKERVTNIVFMARIKDGKVWIEEDNTDLTLADELLKAGLSKDDIVLAFHHPEERHLSEFAVA
ncbi:MAG: XisI protein [Gemmataceae bacterium]|nr:XisI protein [Gemmataceae bacterium]